MKGLKTNQGFTIVELVVVIVVIGILAAVALPRFLGLQDRAHDAVVEGTQAALASGVVMAQSVWLAEGRDSPLDNILQKTIGTTCVEPTASTTADCDNVTAPTGGVVSLDANGKGFPVSHTQYNTAAFENKIGTTTGGDAAAACVEVFEFLLSESSVRATNKAPGSLTPAVDNADSDFEFLASGVAVSGKGGVCTYTYLPDQADNQGGPRTITYDSETGRVTAQNLSSVGATSQ